MVPPDENLTLRHRPLFWLLCLLAWFGVLWMLSSRTGDAGGLPPIPGIDKVAHFGFFFGGGGLFSAFLFRLAPDQPRWLRNVALVLFVFGLIGWLDEFHQTHVPGRSGNDPGDWIADVTGALAGSLVFRRIHRRLR